VLRNHSCNTAWFTPGVVIAAPRPHNHNNSERKKNPAPQLRNFYCVQERRDHFLNAPATSCRPLSSSASLSVKQEIWPRVSASLLASSAAPLSVAFRFRRCDGPTGFLDFFSAPPRSLFPLESSAHALVRRRRES
jgi:hypothetical protein